MIKTRVENQSGVAPNSEDGFKHDPLVFLLWSELALCPQSSCAVLCYVRRFLITLARHTSPEASFGAPIPFHPYWGCVFTESVEKRVSDFQVFVVFCPMPFLVKCLC